MIPWYYIVLYSRLLCVRVLSPISVQYLLIIKSPGWSLIIKWNRIIFQWNSFDPDPINTPEIKWNVGTWVWSAWPGLRCWGQRTGSRWLSQARNQNIDLQTPFCLFFTPRRYSLITLVLHFFLSDSQLSKPNIFRGNIKTIQHVTDKSPISRSAPSYHNQQQQQPSETRCNESLNIVIFKWNIKLPLRKS